MPNRKSLLFLAITAGLLLSGGCTHTPPPSAEPSLPPGVPFVVGSYTPDMRDHYTSWGHTGRGGAALREPAYQPVLSSQDELDTRYGKLYPDLQPRQELHTEVAIPPGMVASKCADRNSVAQAFAIGQQPSDQFITTLANPRGSVNEYIEVRNKLCKGADRLTYNEWLILVNGTPKDLPVRLQAPSQSIQPRK